MGPGHHHPHGEHGDGFGLWWMLTFLMIVLAVLGVFVGVIVLLDQIGVLPEDF